MRSKPSSKSSATVSHSVVVDVPNMWAPWIKYTLVQADDVVITATPELASLRNAKNLIDLLKQARPNDNAPRLILNQVGVPKRPEIPVAEFAKALGVEPIADHPLRCRRPSEPPQQRPDDRRSGAEIEGGRGDRHARRSFSSARRQPAKASKKPVGPLPGKMLRKK